ncbi:hypothetical protein Hanom_Chr07g00646101 [Helianthus anomalus]
MVTKQGFVNYKRSAVRLRRAGFRGWSASHRRLQEKNIRYYLVDREIYISYCGEWMRTRVMRNEDVRIQERC